MAKKPVSKPGAAKTEAGERKSITTLKGSPEWGAWLERLADFDRNTIVGLIDRAVAEYAQNHGFGERPPKR
jgi:hypothetical protein